MTGENTIPWINDHAEVERTMLCYVTAADSGDWLLLRSIFLDRLDIDFTLLGCFTS